MSERSAAVIGIFGSDVKDPPELADGIGYQLARNHCIVTVRPRT